MDTNGVNRAPIAVCWTGASCRRNPGVEFPVPVHSPTRSTGHGLLALLPGKAPDTHVLLAASSFNLALASVLTIPGELQQLRQLLEQNWLGKYFCPRSAWTVD